MAAMGFLGSFRFTRAAGQLVTAGTVILPPTRGDVAQVAQLPASVAAAFGVNTVTGTDTVTRSEAMTIPAMKRGRDVIAGTIGSAPFVATRTRAGNPPERVERSLLTQPDPSVPRSYTLTWTIDALLFYGWALWRVLSRDTTGYPASAEWIRNDRVSVDDGRLRIDGDLIVRDADVIVFRGPSEGCLRYGAKSLRTSLMLEDAVRKFARLDVPLGYFEDAEGSLLEAEITTFLDSWETARASRTTGYIPKGLSYTSPSFTAQQLQLTEARGFQAAEVARMLNLPASAINAPTNDSLTYATTESNRRELVDLTFAAFVVALEQRLSMPDVTPLGTAVALDFGRFLRGDLATVIATGAQAVAAGLMTLDEVRVQWLNLPPLPDAPLPPTTGP